MKRFKNILVYLNDRVGDDDTLSQAGNLAQKNEAILTVVKVLDETESSKEYVAETQKHLGRMTSSIKKSGVTTKVSVLSGTPYLEIIRQVLRNNHDLIMMTAEGNAGYRNLFFGSTSLHLFRKCPCPVWATKPDGHGRYSQIMAAIDLPPDDQADNELNIAIMDLASSLARLNNSNLHIAHAWEVAGKDVHTLNSEVRDKTRDWILRQHESKHQKLLEHLLQRYDLADIQHQTHLVHGVADDLLPQLADKLDIDIIVMGTIGRIGIPGFIIGNTAEMILRQVNCAVLAVKPEGFVSPVTLE